MTTLTPRLFLFTVLSVTAALAAMLTYFHIPASAADQEFCMYVDKAGVMKTAQSRSAVPQRFKGSMRCVKGQQYLAAPDEVTLTGNVRSEIINSPLGEVELRWPRSVESVFGRTPLRATADAALTVSKVVSGSAFPVAVQRLDVDWKVVFLDENLPSDQIPQRLISNCHPGWMTPPGNIYIVAQRVAAGCSGASVSTNVADAQLAEVLVHEFAHAIEYQLLQQASHDKLRAEGFATWFTQFSAGFSSLLQQREIKGRNAEAAAYARSSSPQFSFRGTAIDYARASMYFSTIEDRFGVAGVVSIYERMNRDSLDLFSAIEREFSWNRERLESEVDKVIQRNRS